MSSWRISWPGVLIGGVLGCLITVLSVLFVLPYFQDWYLFLDPIVANGVVGLMLSLLRGSAGIFVGRAIRARHDVDSSVDFVPTAIAAGALAWLLWAVLLGALGDWTMFTTTRGWLELPRWMIELSLGALVVGTQEPERLDWRFRQVRTQQQR
ncbi:hypothetical protein [Ornithinimicrobium panacihumi]|uniref:hypothetical protein n=1 Tax=Ornithinimicrobium panacihumi TaxID=2008449 RepID=UPI003F8CE7FB